MNLKKIGLVLATGAAALTLAACGKNSANEDIVTMKGDTIRVADLYKEVKAYPTTGATTLLQNMTFNKMFEKEFGKKVSADAVNKEFDTQKASYGTSFAAALQQAGYTETSYKAAIRSQLLLKEAINSKIKYTDADYKKAFETFHPTVTAYVLSETTEDAAKATIAKSAEEFDKLAKEKKSELKFNSADTKVPSEVKEAAFKLKDGEVSAPIKVANTQTGTSTYYVVKMIKNADKGTDWKKHKKELKEVITTTKQNDDAFVKGIIADYLKSYNVKVKPTEFANIFAGYQTTTTSSESSSSSKATKSSETKSSESKSSESKAK